MDEDWKKTFSAWTTGILILAAVNAFCAQPTLRYANLELLTWAGSALGMGALIVYTTLHTYGSKVMLAIGALVFLIGCGLAAETSRKALVAARQNDSQCLVIQRAMLFPKPNTRKNLPDVFQALGCRPQRLD